MTRQNQIETVHAQNFAGRDQTNNIEIHLSGKELQGMLDQLLALLRRPQVTVEEGVISVGNDSLTVDPAQADALSKFLAALPVESPAQREERYLARLLVDPAYRRWHRRYVTLSGGYRAVPELTPSYTQILVRGEGPQRQIERVRLPDIRDAVQQHPALILLAPPGAGKSTVLQRLTLDMAAGSFAPQGDPAQRLPLLVRLAAQRENESPVEFLGRMWRQELPGLHADGEGEFALALQQGRLCVLADALNEARREGYSRRATEWADFARNLPTGNRLIFSCRTQDYAGELAVQQVEIDLLTDAQVQDFARRYLDERKGPALWAALSGSHKDLLDLARIPYYLLMMVEIFDQDGVLPDHRAALFAGFVQKLFAREREKQHSDWIDPAAQHLALSQLAFAMQRLGEGTQIEYEEAVAALPQSVRLRPNPQQPTQRTVATPPETLLPLAASASLLAFNLGADDRFTVKFAHHLLQEYFAAEELLRQWRSGVDLSDLWGVPSRVGEMPEAERGEWDPLPGPPTSGWEQTTILAAGLHSGMVDTVRRINPALAARCLLEMGEGATEPALARSREEMSARMGDEAIHLRSRIEAGLLLGRLGDPRFPLETVNGVRVILPPMVEISATTATIGSEPHDAEAESRERPRHPVDLTAYAMGQFPVTNAEYAYFRAAGGYKEEAYWTEGGKYWLRGEKVPGEENPADWWIRTWRRRKENPGEIDDWVRRGWMTEREAEDPWRILITWNETQVRNLLKEWYPEDQKATEPRFWHDESLNSPNQPVVGVNWYEAMAYANWLASLSGQPFRLPTEPEWEWAARRGKRTFPWGNSWDESRLNSLEGRVMRTTPVGVYPQGATPDDIHDLSGNVYEWTATRYVDYPYDPAADLENPAATGTRVTRGGGWGSIRKMVRCGFRNDDDPGDNNYDYGFRLARTSL